jgi:hypothetical protein
VEIFQHLLILGRPAAGKSELIDFLKKTPEALRRSTFHIGTFEELDDFPWLWEVYTEDDEREKRGLSRLHTEKTDVGLNVTTPRFRASLMPRFNATIAERYLARPEFYRDGTLLIEFARGRDDGFRECIGLLSPEILERAAILYIKVSFEESYRRNNARYQAALKSSILSHKVPDKDMYGYFRENDWEQLTDARESGWLSFGRVRVPFVTMPNEPELPPGPEIAVRYGNALGTLFTLSQSQR